MGRMAEAEQVLTEACELFAENVYPFAELADLSTAKGKFDEAVQRWEVVLRRFPSFEFAYSKAAQALCEIGQEAEADEVLRAGITRSPANLAMTLEYARSAHRCGNWTAARERWAMVRDRFPDCAEAREQEITALAAIQQIGTGPMS
jgi:predicted Zn-dependent protease